MTDNTELQTQQNTNQSTLTQIQAAIKAASKGLNTRQVRFAELIAVGDKSGAECARVAGYSSKGADVRSHKLLRQGKIRLLVEKYADLNIFNHGRSVAYYRGQLDELLAIAKEDRNAASGNSIIRTQAELDGHLASGKGGGRSSVTINIVGLDRSGVTIEHERDA